MECSESRLSALYDGELPAPEAEALHGHLEGCARCAATWAELAWLSEGFAALPVEEPNADELAAARSALAAALAEEVREAPPRRPRARPRIALGRITVAAAALLALGLGLWLLAEAPRVSLAWAPFTWARLELPVPEPVVVRADAPMLRSLSAGLRIEASGRATARALYVANDSLGHAHLLTVEAAVHALGHLEEELVQALELGLFRAELPALLEALRARSTEHLRYLHAPEQVAAARQNVALCSIALELLAPGSQELGAAAREELALIVAARGPALSPHFGRELPYALFAPRYGWRGDAARERMFRAIVWLGQTVSLRAEGVEGWRGPLLSLALADARLQDGRSASEAWQRLDGALRFLAGPTADCGPARVIAALRDNFGGALAWGKLERQATTEALAGLPPRWALFPPRRPLPVEVRWELSSGRLEVPRRLPRSLDFEALLGTEAALAVLREEPHAAVLEDALEGLRARMHPLEGAAWYENRHGAWWLATRPLHAPHPWASEYPAWSRRWLALATMRAAGVDAARGAGAPLPLAEAGPPLLVDPYPGLFAGLAAWARFAARAVGETEDAELLALRARLEAYATWAEAVAVQARAQLAGTAGDGRALLRELGRFLPCEEAFSLSDLYFEGPERALYAGCGGIDEIRALVPVGDEVVEARGAGWAVYEWLGPAAPVWTVDDWRSGPLPSRPAWFEEGR